MHIAVRTENGKTIILQVEPTDTIEKVKWKILTFAKLYIRADELKLIFRDKVLDDYKTLEYYGVRNGFQLLVLARLRGGIKLSVQTNNDATINFDVNSSDTVKDVNVKVNLQKNCKSSDYKISVVEEESALNLSVQPNNGMQIFVELGNNIISLDVLANNTIAYVKYKIQELKGYQSDRQRLIFNGLQLLNERTLSDYNIKDKALLRLCLRLTAGGAINMSNNIRILINKANSIIPLDVKLSDTVESVKMMLHKMGCLPPNRQILIYGLRKLQENRTLSENGINDQSQIILAYYVEDAPTNTNRDLEESKILQIFVKCIGGKTIRLYAKPSDTTENIKARIEDLFGYPIDKQKLIFDGRSLQEERTLAEQNISQDSTIRCSIKFSNYGCAQCESNKKRLTYYSCNRSD